MTVKQTVESTNKLGMHARPAMKLFELMAMGVAVVAPDYDPVAEVIDGSHQSR